MALYEDSLNLGAWSWFGDPRAVVDDGKLFVASAEFGVSVSSYDFSTGEWHVSYLAHFRDKLNDHQGASLFVRSDGRILALYADHESIWSRVSTDPGDIRHWGAETLVVDGVSTSEPAHYPNLVQLSAEGASGRLYMFYRRRSPTSINRPQRFRTSDDEGATWSAEATLIDVTTDDRPYCKYASDGVDQIHVAATHGHPGEVTDNSLYHLYYDAGTWRGSDGTDLGTPPFDETDLTEVYDAAAAGNDDTWVYDIALDGATPVILFVTFADLDDDHRYQHARWNGASWDVNEIVGGGGLLAAGTRYSGGLSFDHDNPDVVYLSREVEAGRWEVEKWTTGDGGSSWSSEAITADSTLKNFRPFVPRDGGAIDVLWVAATYNGFGDYHGHIRSNPAPSKPFIPAGSVPVQSGLLVDVDAPNANGQSLSDGDDLSWVANRAADGPYLIGLGTAEYQTAGLNTRAVLDVVTADILMAVLGIEDIVQPFTALAVAALPSTGDDPISGRYTDSDTTPSALLRRDGGSFRWFNGTFVDSSVVADADFHLFTLVADGASSEIRIDRSSEGTGDSGDNPLRFVGLGGRPYSLEGDHQAVKVAAYLVYDRNLSSSEIDDVEGYLHNRWFVEPTAEGRWALSNGLYAPVYTSAGHRVPLYAAGGIKLP